MTDENVRTVRDAATLKAVAHPLRSKLLGALRIDGPATASELARRYDESSGSTSYHLRILEKHGFIEEDPNQPNARDRRWRSVHRYTSWNDADLRADPEAADAVRFMRDTQLRNLIGATRRFEADRDKWGDDWVSAAGHSDVGGKLTAASLEELEQRIWQLIEEYMDADRDNPEAVTVRMFLAAFPTDDLNH